MKILGAGASRGFSIDECLKLGRAVNEHTVTIGSTLDHCHVPGRQHQAIPDDVCVVGAGIHNEPGQQLISPFPSVDDLVKRCLGLLCDQNDSERAFTKFNPDDKVVLLINNYGGLSPLELGALTDDVLGQLPDWNIMPVRTFSGTFETSLNAPGFSMTLCNLELAARDSGLSTDTLLQLLDSETTAVSWPNTIRPSSPRQNAVQTKATAEDDSVAVDLKVDPTLLAKMTRSACERVIAAEPKLTEWDLIMGDGDCGEAVKGLAESVMAALDAGCAQNGSVFEFLKALIRAVDDMGGTLGAIFGILLSAFYGSLKTSPVYPTALHEGVTSLKTHTSARQGDRTVMDVLIPFSDEFVKADFQAALKVAHEKAEATRYLKPKMGRATYVGEHQEVPDPGAWALYEILAGLDVV